MWLSVVCTLIDNDTRHHRGHNVVDSRGAATFDLLNRQRKIRQSDCEISSNCGKSFFLEWELKKELRDTLTPAALSGLL